MTKNEFLKIVESVDGINAYEISDDSFQNARTYISIPQELLKNDSRSPVVKLGLKECSIFFTKND